MQFPPAFASSWCVSSVNSPLLFPSQFSFPITDYPLLRNLTSNWHKSTAPLCVFNSFPSDPFIVDRLLSPEVAKLLVDSRHYLALHNPV